MKIMRATAQPPIYTIIDLGDEPVTTKARKREVNEALANAQSSSRVRFVTESDFDGYFVGKACLCLYVGDLNPSILGRYIVVSHNGRAITTSTVDNFIVLDNDSQIG